jgi:hypothetical protein
MLELLTASAKTTKETNTEPSAALLFLGLLLSADLFYIIFHLIYQYTPFLTKYVLISLEEDRGYPEIFQYMKEFWVAGILAFIGYKTRKKFFYTWSLLFLYLLMDDAISIHEKLGSAIADYFTFPSAFNLRPEDFGELLVSVFFGSFFLFLIGTYSVAISPAYKRLSIDLALLIGVLVVFGVGIDLFHIMVDGIPGSSMLIVVEDGGEMVVLSLIGWYAFNLVDQLVLKNESFVSPLNPLLPDKLKGFMP